MEHFRYISIDGFGKKRRIVYDKGSYYRPMVGERLDVIASKFYGDPRYWWVIAEANPEAYRQMTSNSATALIKDMLFIPDLASVRFI